MKTWHAGAFIERDGQLSLALFRQDKIEGGEAELLKMLFDIVPEGAGIKSPTIKEDSANVHEFLQACLNCAWALGMRPNTSDNCSVYDDSRKKWIHMEAA